MTTIPDKYLIPKQLKLTSKYNDEDKKKVKKLYAMNKSIHSIAKEIPMSRRMVQFILFPERMLLAKQNFALRQKDGRYRYPTNIQSAMVAKVRNRKKTIINQLIKKT